MQPRLEIRTDKIRIFVWLVPVCIMLGAAVFCAQFLPPIITGWPRIIAASLGWFCACVFSFFAFVLLR